MPLPILTFYFGELYGELRCQQCWRGCQRGGIKVVYSIPDSLLLQVTNFTLQNVTVMHVVTGHLCSNF